MTIPQEPGELNVTWESRRAQDVCPPAAHVMDTNPFSESSTLLGPTS
jgi:hypothetical protein